MEVSIPAQPAKTPIETAMNIQLHIRFMVMTPD